MLKTHALLLTSAVALTAVIGVSAAPAKKAAAPAGRTAPAAPVDGDAFFTQQVLPVLQAKCIACHSGEKAQGGLKLTSRAAILKGGTSGPAVASAKPDTSLLVKAINFDGRRMPPQGKLPQAQIEALTRWVRMGAPWPAGDHASLEPEDDHAPPQVNADTMKFWAYQAVKRPGVPSPESRVQSPIDAFIVAKLEAKGLTPNPPADRATLIRRAYYDLTGLPPTPEEVEAFVTDRSPDAWEQVVDRLLASPRYGEKWGRHWLDLVRYAETNSYERDGTKRNAWRYRDYVIESFNADKPYDQFIIEQLAGDELPQRTPEHLIATGYYRMGIWDDEPADPKQALYDDLDDIANTTGQVFLGMTVGCARCHDHKIDPIPQKDYYRFLSFFAGVNRYGIRGEDTVERWSLRPIVPQDGPGQERYRAEIEAYQARMKENEEARAGIEARVLPDLSPVEKEEWKAENRRVPIVRARAPKLLTQDESRRYERLTRERDRLRFFAPMALCVTEVGAKPRDMFVLGRGNPHNEGEKVEPGFPSILAPPQPQVQPGPHGDTSGRRLALARWIASPDNPLTARVMVNRVWQYHFGRGLVRTPSDFGFQGSRPTHPELLDYLASRFAAAQSSESRVLSPESRASRRGDSGPRTLDSGLGWSLKRLHRLIMLSDAYRRSSRGNAGALAKDAENDLFWRFDMRRLQAEEIRDAILAVNGTLNLKAGGPSFYPDIPAEVLAGQSMPGAGWGKSSPEEQARRSVYIFVKRSLPVPIIAAFDGPETDFSCPSRFVSTQPTQALGMLNSQWTNEQAKIFAGYLRKHAGDAPQAQVTLALRRVLQRPPTAVEVERGVRLIDSLQKEEKLSAEDALSTFCVVALNLNEFIYLD